MADQIPLLEKALEVSPDNWPTRRYLIEHFASQGNVEKAGALVKGAPTIPEDEAERLFAAEVLAKAEPQAAQSLLDEILASNAACAQAHVVKAAIQRLAGHDDKAASHIKVAQVLNPDLDVEKAIAEAVAKPEAPSAELPLEVSQAVQVMTAAVAESAVAAEEEVVAEEVVEVVEVDDSDAVEAVEESVVEEEVVPVPLSAVPLRPPGERDAAATATAAAAAAEDSVSVVGDTVDPAYEGKGILPGGATAVDSDDVVELTDEELEAAAEAAERAFIVGDGEMVHAHEKAPDTREKISALTVALLVNIILVAIAWKMVLFSKKNDPPAFVVSSATDANQDELANQKIVKKQQKAAASIQQAAPVVTVSAFSEIAVPDIVTDTTDMSLVTLGDNTGTIGMSMTGIGDVSNMGSIPAAMRSRCSMSQRMKQLRKSGGEERVEGAVRNALEYLATQQDKETGAIGKEFPAAMTGLSLLAFLGHCETPESPKFGNTVISAAQYLMKQGRKNDGVIYNGIAKGNHLSYEHAIGTYALCELYTMTKESGREIPQLESVLRKAVRKIVDGQTGDGGWLYGYNGESNGDYSVSGWQIQALKAAFNTGKRFSSVERSLDNAMKYTKAAQDKDGAIMYRLGDPKGKPTLAGAGVLALQMWDQGDSPQAALGLKYIEKNFQNPLTQKYGAYYNTQALFLEEGEGWKKYNAQYQKLLLDAQQKNGSWKAAGSHGPKGEEAVVYATALSTLMLEVYYRYLPTTEKLEGIKRLGDK